jgi:predicted porin
MKKQLIAAAVASAFVMPAMAQNVTIGGYFEASAVSTNFSENTTPDTNAVDQGFLGSSRMAISGSEDLGGGLKAGFRLESSLGVSGTVSGGAGSSGAGPDVLFNRGAELNISGPFGMVRIGKFDHQGGENTDIVSTFTGNIGLSQGATTNSNNDGPDGVEIGSDRDGTIAYRTPAIAGGYFEIAYTQDDQIDAARSGNNADIVVANAGVTDATHTAQGAVTSVYYQGTIGGVNVRAGYAKQDKKTEAVNAARYGVGFHYNLGVAEIGLSYAKLTTLTDTENKELLVGVKVPLGNGLDLRGTYQDYDAGGSAATSADYKQVDIALVKTLSKRTNAYIGYSDINAGVGATGTSVDRTVMRVGVSHTF